MRMPRRARSRASTDTRYRAFPNLHCPACPLACRNIFAANKWVEEFHTRDIERELGLTREKLQLLALLLGSDYTPGISGGFGWRWHVIKAIPLPGLLVRKLGCSTTQERLTGNALTTLPPWPNTYVRIHDAALLNTLPTPSQAWAS